MRAIYCFLFVSSLLYLYKSIFIMKNLILCCTLLFALNSFGQNLVPNPSFEFFSEDTEDEVLPLTGTFNQPIKNAIPWYKARQTPNYINTEIVDYSTYYNSLIGIDGPDFFYEPTTGSSYVMGYTSAFPNSFDKKEIFGAPLLDSLIRGVSYNVRFSVRLGQGCVIGTDHIGVLFTENKLRYSEDWYIQPPLPNAGEFINHGPQIESVEGVPLNDTTQWVTVSGYFIANGGEQYMSVGCLVEHSLLTIDTLSGPCDLGEFGADWLFAFYFFDDFSVYESGSEGEPAFAGVDTCIVLGDSIQLGYHNYTDYFYEWSKSGEVFSTEGMPWVIPEETGVYGLHQKDFKFTETWSQVSVVVLENPEDECVGLGVNEQLDSEIRVYPNPSNSLVHVNTKTAIEMWALKDALGREVKSSKSIVESPFTIDVSALEIGVYYLELFSKEYRSVKQLVVTY